MNDLDTMADRCNWSAANDRFACDDWGYCAGCGTEIYDDGCEVDGKYYCRECAAERKAEDGQV